MYTMKNSKTSPVIQYPGFLTDQHILLKNEFCRPSKNASLIEQKLPKYADALFNPNTKARPLEVVPGHFADENGIFTKLSNDAFLNPKYMPKGATYAGIDSTVDAIDIYINGQFAGKVMPYVFEGE